MANYLDGMEGGKHNSDNTEASFIQKRKLTVITGDIHFDDDSATVNRIDSLITVTTSDDADEMGELIMEATGADCYIVLDEYAGEIKYAENAKGNFIKKLNTLIS